MTLRHQTYILATTCLFVVMTIIGCSSGNGSYPADARSVQREPHIFPDYADTVIPPNIAPMNFFVREDGTAYHVAIRSAGGDSLNIASGSSCITIPSKAWKNLLETARGKDISITVSVQGDDGAWKRFQPIVNHVARDDIDQYVVYRRLKSLYNYWRSIGIYQRDITSYKERLVFGNKGIDEGCLNCHTFLKNDTESMLIHTRSSFGVAMILAQDGEVKGVNSRTPFKAPIGYSSWHPSGRLVAFSVSSVKQFFHTSGREIRDVIDLDSSLGIYSTEQNTLIDASPEISRRDRMETFPMWSHDGRFLYYSSAPLPWTEEEKKISEQTISFPPDYENVRYDLMRIPFDIESGAWGEPEILVSAAETGKSALLPRLSPNGECLLFTMADHGCFPILQDSSDLYIMDLATKSFEPYKFNSGFTDSWKSWSHNSRWIVLSSKRRDGVFTRLYIAHCDDNGILSKPFLLPEKDPGIHDSRLDNFNIPEFTISPVTHREKIFARANRNLEQMTGIDMETSATPSSSPQSGLKKQ